MPNDNENPYQAPESDLDINNNSAVLLEQPRRVSAGQGFNWLEKGISTYVVPHFSKWLISCSIYALIVVFTQLWLQSLNMAIQFLAPFFTAGALIGCHKIRNSGQISNQQIFEGFSHPNKVQLLLLCLVQAILIVIMVAALFLMSGLSMDDLQKFQQIQSNPEDTDLIISLFKPLLSLLPAMLLLGLAYSIAVWFAPALVVFDNKSAPIAVGSSFINGMKNFLPYIVFLLVTIALFIVLGIIVSIVGFVFGLVSQTLAQAISTMIMAVVSLPILGSALYVGYRDIFYGEYEGNSNSL